MLNIAQMVIILAIAETDIAKRPLEPSTVQTILIYLGAVTKSHYGGLENRLSSSDA